MKITVKLSTLFLLVFSINLFASSTIEAIKVLGNVSDIGPQSRAWLSAPYSNIVLYPLHVGIDENTTKAKKARVKAVHDGKNISFLIEWNNTNRNELTVDFALDSSDISRLPYVDMGDENRGLIVYSNKLYEQNIDVTNHDVNTSHNSTLIQEQKIFIANGFDSIKKIDDSSSIMNMIYKNGTFKATLSKKLKETYLDLGTNIFPISFALNNDSRSKIISSWMLVNLNDKNNDTVLNNFDEKTNGNSARGEKLTLENCAGCHRYKNIKLAPSFMSPELSNIGGYSTSEYLIESLIEPSAVVMSGNSNNTYANFDWYTMGTNGKKVSVMPTFNWLDEESINDIVAFMKTLKATIE